MVTIDNLSVSLVRNIKHVRHDGMVTWSMTRNLAHCLHQHAVSYGKSMPRQEAASRIRWARIRLNRTLASQQQDMIEEINRFSEVYA